MSDDTLEAAREEVLGIHRAFLAANEPLDSSYLRKHAADGDRELVWFNLNQSNYWGLDHICKLWDMLSAILAGQQAKASDLREERVEISGDLAVVTYLVRYTGDFGNLGTFDTDCRGTEVWKRHDGEWKLIHGHWSDHVPGQMGGD